MATLEDLFFSGPEDVTTVAVPSDNPFQGHDRLLESQIIEIRYDGITSTLGLILEMRVACWLPQTSTALLLASGVSHFSWMQIQRHDERTAWTIVGSVPTRTEAGWNLELVTSPSATMALVANRVAFYTLRIADLEDSAPPSYVEQEMRLIRRGIARWDSEVEIVAIARAK